MPRKKNQRAVEFIKQGLAQGKSPKQILAEGRKYQVSKSLIQYYAYGGGKATKQFTAPQVPVATSTSFSTKILRAKKILDADFLDEDLRVELAQKVLA